MTGQALVDVIKLAIAERTVTLSEAGKRQPRLDAILEASDCIATMLRTTLNDTKLN